MKFTTAISLILASGMAQSAVIESSQSKIPGRMSVSTTKSSLRPIRRSPVEDDVEEIFGWADKTKDVSRNVSKSMSITKEAVSNRRRRRPGHRNGRNPTGTERKYPEMKGSDGRRPPPGAEDREGDEYREEQRGGLGNSLGGISRGGIRKSLGGNTRDGLGKDLGGIGGIGRDNRGRGNNGANIRVERL
ncbi:hypothetical protein K7432_015641 [Basidiobolus ranarum]|uniref:Uncharacterized protein n=1 Tax=Basidiobolus ranarum TaxID=34480 RepID=A0ABR2WFT7_9FUNG